MNKLMNIVNWYKSTKIKIANVLSCFTMENIVMYAIFIPLLIVTVILMLIQFLFGWVLAIVLVITGRDYYPYWLNVFQPTDSPAVGDKMFGDNEAKFTVTYPSWKARYVRAIMWGQRNPAYGFTQRTCAIAIKSSYEFKSVGVPYVDIGWNDATGECIANLGSIYRTVYNGCGCKSFQFIKAARWGKSDYGYMISFGWNLEPNDKDYKGQPRIKDGTSMSLQVGVRPRISLKSKI